MSKGARSIFCFALGLIVIGLTTLHVIIGAGMIVLSFAFALQGVEHLAVPVYRKDLLDKRATSEMDCYALEVYGLTVSQMRESYRECYELALKARGIRPVRTVGGKRRSAQKVRKDREQLLLTAERRLADCERRRCGAGRAG